MRLSFDWLSDFVDLSGISPQEVADKLTMGAFEVEEVRRIGADIQGPVVVGEILEINPHPNADKIRLTKVRVAPDAEPLEIVCGAPNIVVGQRIPVALVGAQVLNRHDGTILPIKPTKIRGVPSNGMLCSAPELGISTQEDGIYILYGVPALGTDIKKLLQLEPDYVLHVEPRSNRGDALSVYGLAREVAALCKRNLHEPLWHLPEEDCSKEAAQIYIENQDDCPYFSIRILQGLHVKESPLQMRKRLEAIGVRPINNIVDVTNYVLHEFGQPLHAYDLAKLRGPVVEVRRARKGENITTLDGKQRDLTEEALVVADSHNVVAVAGVMGGKDSEVSDETAFVALEAASFTSARVRRSGRLLGLSSDSSLRFERGVDVATVHRASDRAAFLMLENCGGLLGRFTSSGNDQAKKISVAVRLPQIKRILDVSIDSKQAADLLSPLGFEVKENPKEVIDVSVPSFRQKDVSREVDVIEEICRCWGYDRIEPLMPHNTIAANVANDTEARARQVLAACGLSETWISSLTGIDETKALDQNDAILVLNPLSQDHQALRQSLIPGLIKAVTYNQDHGRRDVWLFEVGRTYKRKGKSSAKDPGVFEELKVAGVICGQHSLSHWKEDKPVQPDSRVIDWGAQTTCFYTAKGIVENLLEHFGFGTKQVIFLPRKDASGWMHPGRSASVTIKDKDKEVSIGNIGELHPTLAYKHDFKLPLYLFEISLDTIRTLKHPHEFNEIPVTPFMVRDLTVDIDLKTTHHQVNECIVSAGGASLKHSELVSIFSPSPDKRSLSFRLTFQHPETTLTNEQVDADLAQIRKQLEKQLSASFRT